MEESLAIKSDALEDLSIENHEKQEKVKSQQSQQSGLKTIQLRLIIRNKNQ